ncbi:MAG TPA: nucleotidyl transferase AbiEii/AbiGii toxin family protein [Bacteroidales bacterium]|nr:nucleotidyl transferase AbiEii/AbiGii toxin family protein [Bacteroidales bacterium]
MVDLYLIKNYFPEQIRNNALLGKSMMKEYIQLSILDYLSTTPYIRKLVFIGGTSLRLVKGSERFSEDLDFDCKEISKEEFMQMSDDVMHFLQRNGYKVESRDKNGPKLKAVRRNIYFPCFLFDMGLSGHRDERFLIKIEAQDQGVNYTHEIKNIKGCGFYFPFPVPPAAVLCAMKATALLERGKGRDFYDLMFLLGQTKPDYEFLSKRIGIKNAAELKTEVKKRLQMTDLKAKTKDFDHLLFNKDNSKRILRFKEFFEESIL